jgi:proteasome lid subunit RPN8/RPN11
MQIAPDLLQQVIDHALRDAPDECCGYLVLDGDRVVEVVEVENVARSPFRFEIHPDVVRVMGEIEDGLVIYHSHTRSEPRPSQTDMNFAKLWPGVDWLIIGVAGGGEPDIRNWRIESGSATQVEVLVDAGV